MKIQQLRRKIAINFIASVALLAAAAIVAFYISNKQKYSDQEIDQIHREASVIRSQTQELESQTSQARKYKEVWKTLSDNKKSTRGIRMDDVNKIIGNLADKYNLYAPSIQVVLPENLDAGVFQRKTINVSYSSVTLSFDALSDVKALAFISEFFNKLPGYTVISSIEMTKSRKYNQEDFINISLGKNPSILKVKVLFAWYIFHEKLKQVEVDKK